MIENININQLTNWFYKGKYREVIGTLGRRPLGPTIKEYEHWTFLQIGSLVFLGENREAEILFEQTLQKISTSDLFKTRCRFYLGISCVRRSTYVEAAQYFAKNISSLKKSLKQKSSVDLEIQFYAYQGSAFFRFFRGQHNRAQKLSEKAYAAAFAAELTHGQVLSLDLLGHSLCQIGSIRRGILELNRALKLASKMGHGGIVTALKVSLVKYHAQFGLEMDTAVTNLLDAIQNLDPQDTYSRAELYLELVRQLVLRGRGSEAQAHLDSAGSLVYSHRNKRQSALFNLRFANLLLLRGEGHAALALIHSVRSNLDPRIDLEISQQVNGLEKKIRAVVGANPTDDSLSLMPVQVTNIGEDPLGDLMSKAAANGLQAFYEIKQRNMLGLLPTALNIPIGTKGIYLGPSRREMILFSGSDIVCVDQSLTAPIKKILGLLGGGAFRSKEFLIKKIWHYEYDPEMHDRLLHATIGKLRKILGPFSTWLEWSNEGYRLNPQIAVFQSPESVENPPTRVYSLPNESKKEATSSDLNIRQVKTLKSLQPGQFWQVRDYAKNHRVCTMTACRDLSALHRQGHLVRIGKGRSTVYTLPF